jgi:hypothetical protein
MALLPGRFLRRAPFAAGLLAFVVFSVTPALGQSYQSPRQARWAYRRSSAPCAPPVSPTLGTFAPTPYVMVRGNWPAGGGYSPLNTYGDMTLPLYGPLSSLRATSAPVTVYSRGYNGTLEATPATSFSNPNLPALSPVVYPRPSNYYYAPRIDRSPPSWSNGMDWIDQQ